MSIGSNRLLDELSRLATDAVGAAQGVRREASNVARGQMDRLTQSLDLVSREEFEAVRDMAVAARAENDRLSARLAALETQATAAKPGGGAEFGSGVVDGVNPAD